MADHVIRYLPRDWKLFARMRCASECPEHLALQLGNAGRDAVRADGPRPASNVPAAAKSVRSGKK